MPDLGELVDYRFPAPGEVRPVGELMYVSDAEHMRILYNSPHYSPHICGEYACYSPQTVDTERVATTRRLATCHLVVQDAHDLVVAHPVVFKLRVARLVDVASV